MKYKVSIKESLRYKPDGVRQTIAIIMFLMRLDIVGDTYYTRDIEKYSERLSSNSIGCI